MGVGRGCYTIDVRKNKLSALPLRVRHVLRDRLPKVARCASCGNPPTAMLRRCRCGGTKIKLTPQDFFRIERSINRRNRHNRDWREALLPGHHTKDDITKTLGIQDGRCYFCNWKLIWRDGRKFPRSDHLIPITDPRSSNWPSNIVLVCPHCNSTKSNLSADEFWHRLEEVRSSDSIHAQKARAHRYDLKRRKLDRQRKDQVKKACEGLENNLRSALKEQKIGGAPFGVKLQRRGVIVHVGLVTFRFPASFHSRIAKWSESRLRIFTQQMIAASDAAGGLIVRPY